MAVKIDRRTDQMVNNLQKLGKKSISATDISSQFWCERQMELGYLVGREKTKEMLAGTKIHDGLQDEVYLPLEAKPRNYADYMYKVGYEDYFGIRSLKDRGLCRESLRSLLISASSYLTFITNNCSFVSLLI